MAWQSRGCPMIRLDRGEHDRLRQHGPVLGAVGRSRLVDPLAGGADNVAAGRAGALDVAAGLPARAGGDQGVCAVLSSRRGSFPVGLEPGMRQGTGGVEDGHQKGKEGRSWACGAHGSEEADAAGDRAVSGSPCRR